MLVFVICFNGMLYKNFSMISDICFLLAGLVVFRRNAHGDWYIFLLFFVNYDDCL